MTKPSLHEEFMRTFIAAEPKLRAYAFACGLSREQVDDLAQEAALVLWRKFESYDRSRSFLSWALGIAHHLLQEARREATQFRRMLAPEVATQLAQTCARMDREIDVRRSSLRTCVDKLPGHLRELLSLRYGERRSLGEIGERLGRGLSAVNMALHRIRQLLLECVQREGLA